VTAARTFRVDRTESGLQPPDQDHGGEDLDEIGHRQNDRCGQTVVRQQFADQHAAEHQGAETQVERAAAPALQPDSGSEGVGDPQHHRRGGVAHADGDDGQDGHGQGRADGDKGLGEQAVARRRGRRGANGRRRRRGPGVVHIHRAAEDHRRRVCCNLFRLQSNHGFLNIP
jgi:hypothetical protein